MTFALLPIEIAAAVAAGAALVLVVAFLVRPGRKVVVVPSLRSIRQILPDAAVIRGLATWPRRLLGLLLAFAVAAATTFAATGPTLTSEPSTRTLVIVDVSPSMAAKNASGTSRIEEARSEALTLLGRLGERPSVAVGIGGARLTLLTPWLDDGIAAVDAVNAIRVGKEPLDPVAVLADAAAVLGPAGGRVVWVSDLAFVRPPPVAGVEEEAIRVGEDSGNAAVTSFAARLRGGRRDLADAVVRVTVPDASGTVSLWSSPDGTGGWTLAAALPVPEGTGADREVRFSSVPMAGPFLQARLAMDCPALTCNALDLDDSASVMLPGARPLRVLVVGPRNHFLESALSVQANVAVERGESLGGKAPPGIDFLIVNDVPGRIPPNIPTLLIRPRPGNGRVEVAGTLRNPEFDPAAESDPVADRLLLADVNVASAVSIRPAPQDRIVFASRTGHPLILRRDDPAGPTLAVAFGLEATDFGLRYSWPLFLSNALVWAAGERPDFAAADLGIAGVEARLSAIAEYPAFTGEARPREPDTWREARAFFPLAVGLLALLLLLAEWAIAQRRPDVGV